MALISKLNIQNGSLIDQVTGLQATIVGSKLKLEQTPTKGFMLSNNGTTGNYVDIPNSTTMTNNGDWSVAVGLNLTSTINQGILTKGQNIGGAGWKIYYYSKTLRFNYGVDYVIPYTINENIHVVITYLSGRFYIYKNGVLLTSILSSFTNNVSPIRLTETFNNTTGSTLKGKIGTPSIYNHALTQSEINNLYKEWLTPKSTVNLIRESEVTLPNEYKDSRLVAVYSGNLTPDRKCVDKSGNNNSLNTNGNPINVNGIQFNGKDYFQRAVFTQISKSLSFSIATIIKPKNIINYQGILSNFTASTNRFQLFIKDGYIQVTFQTSTAIVGYTVKAPITANIVTTVLVIHDINIVGVCKFKLYVNGILYNTDTGAFELANTGTCVIGADSNGANGFYTGSIKELLIYNSVLSTNEIKQYHNKWVQPVLIEKFNYGADGITKEIPSWIKKSGSFKIGEFVKQQSYYSDFSSDTNGWSGTRSIVSGNNDSVFGKDNVLKLYADGSNGSHFMSKPYPTIVGKTYKFKFKYYLPSGQTNVNRLQLDNNVVGIANILNPVLDTWTTHEVTFKPTTGSGVSIYIWLTTLSYQGLNDPNNDRLFITDFEITEIEQLPNFNKTKYLECVTNGIIALPSNQAYGSWELDLYKGADGNNIEILPISSTNYIKGAAYDFNIKSNEGIDFLKSDGTNYIVLTRTISSYIQNFTWYRIRITRTISGVFTVYILGGTFTTWTLVSTTGGSGTNPVTDNTYQTSNYFVLDIDAGDRIANIQLVNGIKV